MKKKVMCMLLTGMMAASMIAGCGNSGNASANAGAVTNTDAGTDTSGAADNSTDQSADVTPDTTAASAARGSSSSSSLRGRSIRLLISMSSLAITIKSDESSISNASAFARYSMYWSHTRDIGISFISILFFEIRERRRSSGPSNVSSLYESSTLLFRLYPKIGSSLQNPMKHEAMASDAAERIPENAPLKRSSMIAIEMYCSYFMIPK